MDKEEESYDSTSLQMTATFDTSTRNYCKQQQSIHPKTYSLNQLDKISRDCQRMNENDDNDDNSNTNNLNSLIYTTIIDDNNNNDNHLSQQNDHLSTHPRINDSIKENENNNNRLHLKNKLFFTNNKYNRSTTGIDHHHNLLKGQQSQSQRLLSQQKSIEENIITDDLLLQLEYNDESALNDDEYNNNKSSNNSHISNAGLGNESDHRFSKLQQKHTYLDTAEENVENLLLEMEINEDINDSDDDDKNKMSICNDSSIIKNTLQQSTQLNNILKKENDGNNKNKNQPCNSVDDLLVAMESEEAAIDDEEEDKEGRDSNNITSYASILNSTDKISAIITNKYNNIDTTANIHTNYEKKIDNHHSLSSASKRRKLTFSESIPHNYQLDDNDPMPLTRIEKWKCTFCKFMNTMDQEICVICRCKPNNRNELIEHSDYSPLKQTLQQQSTISNIIDTSPVFIPATIQITASQAQTSQYLNQTISIMSTALNKNDSISIDSAMTKVIDLDLKLEICSNIRDIDQVTHIITSINSDGLCARTSKYLIGIITGKWIVDTSWLLTSIQVGYWLPEQDYEVRGDKTLGCTDGPKRGRERDLDQSFFHDRQFFFYGDYPSKEKLLLMQLVTVGGGTVYSRRPSEKKKDVVIIIIPSISILLKKNKSTVWLNCCKYVKDRDWLIETVARGTPLDF
ncbi:unnamed protein product [Cunninghamella echinulata]